VSSVEISSLIEVTLLKPNIQFPVIAGFRETSSRTSFSLPGGGFLSAEIVCRFYQFLI
jgi:hypothetical protein